MQFQMLAPQHTMALLIGGRTVHSWGKVPINDTEVHGDVDELFELLETELSDVEVELRYTVSNPDDDDDDDDDDEEDDDEEDGHERLDENYMADEPML